MGQQSLNRLRDSEAPTKNKKVVGQEFLPAEKWCFLPLPAICETVPASSKWPFDHPNRGHLAPEKVTWTPQKGHERKNLVGFFSRETLGGLVMFRRVHDPHIHQEAEQSQEAR